LSGCWELRGVLGQRAQGSIRFQRAIPILIWQSFTSASGIEEEIEEEEREGEA